MPTLILVRHGQSDWNLQNRFTGWVDVDLSAAGVEEARAAGRALAEEGIRIDRAFTSVLKRAIRAIRLVLDEMDQMWVPVERSWRLNERHYGALQGLDKAETAAAHGAEQVKVWRRRLRHPSAFSRHRRSEPSPVRAALRKPGGERAALGGKSSR